VRGLLDPLRALSPGQSCLNTPDPAASTLELAEVIDRATPAPSGALRSALESVRSGAVTVPSGLASALAPIASPQLRRPGRRRRGPGLLVAGCCGVLAVVAAAVLVHERDGGGKQERPSAQAAPVARMIARIPLGLTGDEVPPGLAILGRTAWVGTTNGRLLRVDVATNQLVGDTIKLGEGKHSVSDMTVVGGNLYAIDNEGWLFRVDSRTGRVVARRRVDAHPGAILGARGVLWVAGDRGRKGVLLRFDASTLRPIGSAIDALPSPRQIALRGSRAWVVGGAVTGEVLRVDTASAERRHVYVGPQVGRLALAARTLWLPDFYNGTVSPLDTDQLVFKRPAVRVSRVASGVLVAGRDLWVASQDDLAGVGPLRLTRFDSASGRRAGSAVVAGRGVVFRMSFARGQVWVLTQASLNRLAPSSPRPALDPEPAARAPLRTFIPGPLQAGSWRASKFVAPFTFSTPAFAWLGVFPQPDSVELLATRDRRAEIDVAAPRQIYTANGGSRAIGSPESVLAALRENPRLSASAVHRTSVAARPAIQFELRARNPKSSQFCGPTPCVLLFPTKESTLLLTRGELMRISLLRSSGRTIVIVECGVDAVAFAATASVLRTFRFKQ
jgi:hypothetical protein